MPITACPPHSRFSAIPRTTPAEQSIPKPESIQTLPGRRPVGEERPSPETGKRRNARTRYGSGKGPPKRQVHPGYG